jgi:hypothetical protein
MRQYRVLVIDDDAAVLSRLRGRISRSKRDFEHETWQIDIATVHIELQQGPDGRYGISYPTLLRLAESVLVRPDLILTDYGFMDRDRMSYWRDQHARGHMVTLSDFAGEFLTPVELIAAARDIAAAENMDSKLREALRRNLLDYDGRVVIYSMTSRAFIGALGEIETRRANVDAALPIATVEAVNPNYELYNRDEFVDAKHDPAFYAHLIGGLIDKVIQINLLEAMLNQARNLKYLRVRKSVTSVAIVVALGAGTAAVGDLIGSQITVLLKSGDYGPAALVAGFAVALVFFVGIVLPFGFGKIMTGLLGTGEAPEE